MSVRPIHSICGIGTNVWVPAPAKTPFVFQVGKVLAVDEISATVRVDSENETKIVQIDLVNSVPMICNTTVEADMTSLYHIHEPAILYNLEQRSLQSQPYTFMGPVLVTVNPLRVIPDPCLPGSPNVLTGPPHPFVVAETAYQQMIFQVKNSSKSIAIANQSIVIAGESGAGKTEASKMILAHLVARSSKSDKTMDLDKRLLGTNPILESFGNSVTLRNPNSSRFGKMLRLQFEHNQNVASLKGSSIQSYLLERSRVTSHEPGERTFHIFYQIIASVSDPELKGAIKDLPIKSKFRYTEPGGSSPQTVTSLDTQTFKNLVGALENVGISSFYRLGIFEILFAILYLGEIEFIDVETNEGNLAKASTEDSLNYAAQLLGIDPSSLSKVFCERSMIVDKERVVSKRNARGAGFARDAAAKAIYSSLFDWVVRRVNESIGEKGSNSNADTSTTLGVLDIFGFESFQVNRFEQLLINFANESLQGTFNGQVFVAEASLYQKEGLFGADDYLNRPADNSICVELLQGDTLKKQPGLLSIIDSEGKSPDANDLKLNQRIHTTFGTHPCMIRPHPKDASKTFIVRHYAGPVVYTIGTFLEKNNDRLPEDMEKVLTSSSKSAVKELFEQPSISGSAMNKKAPPPSRSIVIKFASQIRTLVEDLEVTKCSFIRCVKPNPSMFRDDKDPSWFDRRYVTKQLNALNIPQTAEVLRNGFPTRIEYSVLVESYWSVLPKDALKRYEKGTRDDKAFVRALFYSFGVKSDSYKLGNTKVFFKSGQLAQLDSILKAANSGGLSEEVLYRFRMCYSRAKWRKYMLAALFGEKLTKLYLTTKRRNDAAIKIQKFLRAVPIRKRHEKLKKGARVVQRIWRGRKGRQVASKLRVEKIALARKQAEEARAKKDKEAAERAFQIEKEMREAEERAKVATEIQKRAVLEALRKQVEQRNREEREFVRRKSSFHPASLGSGHRASAALRRSTRVTVASGNSDDPNSPVYVKSGGKLRAKTVTQRRAVSMKLDNTLQMEMDIPQEMESNIQRRSLNLRGDLKRNSMMKTTVEAARRRASRRLSQMPQGTPIPAMLAAAAASASVAEKQKKVRHKEGKSALERVATAAREEFGIKVLGFAFVLKNSDPLLRTSSKIGLISRLKHRISSSAKSNDEKSDWERLYYVLDKPGRHLTFFADSSKKEIVKTFQLKATLKVTEHSNFNKRSNVIELKDHSDGSIFVSFESFEEERRWERDIREAVIGFRAPVRSVSTQDGEIDDLPDNEDDGDDERMGELYELYAAQLRQERVAQLAILKKNNQISQKEFDEACEIIANAAEFSVVGETEMEDAAPDEDFGAQVQCPKCKWSNNTMFGRYKCVKCGMDLPKPELGVGETDESIRQYRERVVSNAEPGESGFSRGDGAVLGLKPLPLTSPFAENLAFEDGRVSCELIGAQKVIDFATYHENTLYGIDIRFRDEEDSNLEIGWVVSHRLQKFQDLFNELMDPNGPLSSTSRRKVPGFRVKEDDPNCLKNLNDWLKELFELAPSGGKQTNLLYIDDDDEADSEEPADKTKEKPIEETAAAWRSIRDPESGDIYYFNKFTGKTTWNDPFHAPLIAPNVKLLPDWEPVLDRESGDTYYWNKVTNETTWDIPILKKEKNSKKKKVMEGRDLLHIPSVNRFLDLKRNARRMEEMAL